MANTIDTSNYVWLAMTAHGWGWSPRTEAEAVNECRKHMGTKHVRECGYITFRVHPDFEIGPVDGTIYTPEGHPVIQVHDRTVKKAAKK